MVLFRNKDEILDLTDLQRRGILKKSAEVADEEQGSNGYVELHGSTGGSSSESVSGCAPNPFGFLDSLAGAAGSGVEKTTIGSGGDSLELQGLKNKIDDLEYKLDRLMEKVAKMEGS
ncbi:MAG: hypothetical protein KJ600_06935 [Nanoarchaeota archaeon]|nr:hypothetical protein [Nanoarchaeota archaeon]MBU1104259.1 hypothetical protein [Nanoarchaeota archaeon]